ncbi:hypothetical protein QEZ54_14260 [Catellatospora sp. KI3]|uniref:hypothetical protein n=1 Tax=Catellatospora sp. KI3 TaxID=3041620 RepID=UPI00248212C7|nr:hypothetical protein [Catellatospora sp. KI3]MDI1462133.1 hypothetical protein [Catellatospora sp. KI3]
MRWLRLDARIDHEEIAAAARGLGLDWSVSWLASVERGTKPLSAEQLLVLPVVLGTACKHRVAIADLLVGDEAQALIGPAKEQIAVDAAKVRDSASGAPMRRAFGANSMPAEAAAQESPVEKARRRQRDIISSGFGWVDSRLLAVAEAGATAAEERLARKLGVPVVAVVAAAATLWGRSLTEQTEAERGNGEPVTHVKKRLTGEVTVRVSEAAQWARETGADGAGDPDLDRFSLNV